MSEARFTRSIEAKSVINHSDAGARSPALIIPVQAGSGAPNRLFGVMAGLAPAIHVFSRKKGVDARDKRGHDA
jgi:hypothetical protein